MSPLTPTQTSITDGVAAPTPRTMLPPLARVRVADAMTSPAQCVAPTTDVRNAVSVMDAGGFDHLLVVDGHSVRTLCRWDLWRSSSRAPVAGVARDAPRLSPGLDLRTSLCVLDELGTCSLPVVVPGGALGIITARDICAVWPNALPVCASCGGHHRVRGGDSRFCVECDDTMQADPFDPLYVDLGSGD